MPTAPAILPTAISSRAATSAAARPPDLGVEAGEHEAGRDRLGVDAVRAADHRRRAVLLGAAAAAPRAAGRRPPGSRRPPRRSRMASDASSTSDEVMPRCSQRAGSPASSSTWVRNAMTSCARALLDLEDARRVELARRPWRAPPRRFPRGRCPAAPWPRRRPARPRARCRSGARRTRSVARTGRVYLSIMLDLICCISAACMRHRTPARLRWRCF